MIDSRAREFRLRRRAAQLGLVMRKSRMRLHLNNLGGYMLINARANRVVAGSRFELDFDDIDEILTARAAELRAA